MMFYLVDFCRLCLSNENDLNNMCYDNIIEKVQACIHDLEFDEHTPALICSKCLEQLDQFFEFRNRCLQSEFLLTRYIDKLTEPQNKRCNFVSTNLKVKLLKDLAVSNKRLGNVRVSKSFTNEPDMTISDDSIISVDDDDDIFFEEILDVGCEYNEKKDGEEQEKRNKLSDSANFLATDITEHVKTRKRQVQILAEEKIRKAFEGDVSITETHIKTKKGKLRAKAQKKLKRKKKYVNLQVGNSKECDEDSNDTFEIDVEGDCSVPFSHSLLELPDLHSTLTKDCKNCDLGTNVFSQSKKQEITADCTDKLFDSGVDSTEFSHSCFDDITTFNDTFQIPVVNDPLDINEANMDFEMDSLNIGKTIDMEENPSQDLELKNTEDLLCYETLNYNTIDSDPMVSSTETDSSPNWNIYQNSAEVRNPALLDHNYIRVKTKNARNVLIKPTRANNRLNHLLQNLKKKTERKNKNGLNRYFYDSALSKYNLPIMKRRRNNQRTTHAVNVTDPAKFIKESTGIDDLYTRLELKRNSSKQLRQQFRLCMQLLWNVVKQPTQSNCRTNTYQGILNSAILNIKNLNVQHKELEKHKKYLQFENEELLRKLKNLYFIS